MWRFAGRVSLVVGCLVAGTFVSAAPASAAQGVTVRITEVTGRFEAGAAPAQMTVVATKRTRECIKVRWSLVVQVEDMSLDQITIDRREEDGSFPVDFQASAREGRLTDERLDPGTLCRNRTVTARYTLAFDDDATGGRVTLRAEAYDVRNEPLEADTVTRNVQGDPPPTPTPTPSEEPAGEATEEAEAPVAGGGVAGPITPAATSGGSGLLPVGLAVGGMMVFLGLTLLLRARRKLARTRAQPVGRPGTRGTWQGGAARTIRDRR